ncbi:MAG TPA: CehA/McbA family metallohydrolase [Bryobacteraceae bacterium]|nr:CehA/McbA family metallohydrolase [Bryobacteraceae bacterium]
MRGFALCLCGTVALTSAILIGQTESSTPEYHIYAGNLHAHTAYTWSHGEQIQTNGCAGILTYTQDPNSPAAHWSDGYVKTAGGGCPGIYVINGSQIPAPGVTIKPDWQKVQGPPSAHYAAAKAAGYDFYAATDHSQDAGFQPPSPENPTWLASRKQAAEATDANFVAIAGFEYSENDGPAGEGHINVYNTSGILNALLPGIDLPYLYKWLESAPANGDGPVVASFNHPDATQYNDWAYRDPKVTDIITMLEVINSNNKIHYPGFIAALDHGWKVSPICGNDNHGMTGITKQTSRTFVLATAKTKAAILDAMKNRRTYASLDKSMQARYSVNGAIMGSTLNKPANYRFDIRLSSADRITKVDIVKDGGAVVSEFTPPPGNKVHWETGVTDPTSKYFFVRVWTSRGGDAPGAKPENPVAWLAPVWTGR